MAILIQKKFLTGEHSESMRGKRVEGKKVIKKKKKKTELAFGTRSINGLSHYSASRMESLRLLNQGLFW